MPPVPPVRPTAPELLTAAELRARLRAAAQAVGGLRAWAHLHGINEKTVYGFSARPVACPAKIVDALGCARVVRYVVKEPTR